MTQDTEYLSLSGESLIIDGSRVGGGGRLRGPPSKWVSTLLYVFVMFLLLLLLVVH